MTATAPETATPQLIMEARGLVKRYGHVTAIGGADFELADGEILAVVGDNGAGKSSMIKALTGALEPDEGEILINGEPVRFRSPLDARLAGIETVYQELAVAASLDITQNLFLGREIVRGDILGRLGRKLDTRLMRKQAAEAMDNLGIRIQSIRQRVETLSGGQRQAVAVARAATWAKRVVIMDEPTAALGVRETNQVLDLITRVRENGLPVVLISHNMPDVFQVADRVHIHRLGRRATVVRTRDTTPSEVVGVMTGAQPPDTVEPAIFSTSN